MKFNHEKSIGISGYNANTAMQAYVDNPSVDSKQAVTSA